MDAEASLRTGGASPDQFGSGVRVSLGPSFKRYRDDRGPVSPYSMWGVGVTGGFDYLAVDDPGTDDQASWLAGVYGKLGLGVDWFPLERVSIGGHVALRLAYELVTGSGDAPTEHAVRLDARSSAIVVHWYF